MSKYALTIHTPESNFQGTNTYIITDDINENVDRKWLDGGKELHKILAYLVGKSAADAIISNHLWFVRNCDDVDLSLTATIVNQRTGEEKTWEEATEEDF